MDPAVATLASTGTGDAGRTRRGQAFVSILALMDCHILETGRSDVPPRDTATACPVELSAESDHHLRYGHRNVQVLPCFPFSCQDLFLDNTLQLSVRHRMVLSDHHDRPAMVRHPDGSVSGQARARRQDMLCRKSAGVIEK